MSVISIQNTYDDLYRRADALMKHYNPCAVQDGTCYRGRRWEIGSFCCDGCNHLTRNGCRAKSLACRLWVCETAYRVQPQEFKDELHAIMREASIHELLYFRASRNEILKYGSLNKEFIEGSGVSRTRDGVYYIHKYLRTGGAMTKP